MGIFFSTNSTVDPSLQGGGGNVFFVALKPAGVIQGTFNNYVTVTSRCVNQLLNDGSAYAQNDGVYWYVMLSPGTYTLQIAGHKDINRGILTVKLDATTIATLDEYAAAGTEAIMEQTGITVAAGKLYQLKIQATTKNAASVGYGVDLAEIHFIKTA